MSRTEQRACPVCGTAFTWTSASPRQKYCSTRCAQLCWERAHRRRSQRQPAAGDPGRHDDQARHDDDAHHDDDPRRPDGNGQPPAAIAACPHCRKPVNQAATVLARTYSWPVTLYGPTVITGLRNSGNTAGLSPGQVEAILARTTAAPAT